MSEAWERYHTQPGNYAEAYRLAKALQGLEFGVKMIREGTLYILFIYRGKE